MQSFAPGRSRRPAPARRASAAFTLLELLIAIAIIGILASLILTVAGSANIKAKNAQVTFDIKDLEKGIAAFKQRFGTEPPSRITLYEQGTTTNNTPSGWNGDPRSMGLIRQIWPQFDFTIDRDINNNPVGTTPTIDAAPIHLTGSECLVFFLGGIPDLAIAPGAGGSPGRAPLGFSQNPANPFAIGGSNREKFMEFNISRLTDVDGDGMMEYADTLPGQVQIGSAQGAWPFWQAWSQSTPYLYFSSYGGQGYDVANDVVTPSPPGGTFIDVYRQGPVMFWAPTGAGPPTPAAPLTPPPFTPATGVAQAWNPNSYQIISPGADHKYGAGGFFTTDHVAANPPGSPPEDFLANEVQRAKDLDTNGMLQDRTGERDNITNFSSGVFAP